MAEEANKSASEEKEVPSSNAANDMKGMLHQLEATLDEYMITKAPFHIPANGKELIVKIAPYLVIIGIILFIPALLALLGIGALLSPFAMMGGYGMMGGWGFGVTLSLVTGVAVFVLEAMAISGLFKRTRSSWNLLFYASIVSLIGNILSFNVVGGVLGAIIGWYILFQVKELYKN